MSKIGDVVPNVGKITKNVVKQFIQDSKIAKNDAILCMITLAIIIAWIFIDSIMLEGAAAILFAYSWLVVRRVATYERTIKQLKDKILNDNRH